jgi:2-oxo-3-hexenedioate decarboxylase
VLNGGGSAHGNPDYPAAGTAIKAQTAILDGAMTMQANTEDPRIVAGMAAQGRLRESRLAAGERRVGWKAGLGTAQAMEKVSITAPLTGFLTNASLASGMTRTDGLSIDDWRNAMLEPEVAVRIGTDLAAGADRRTVEAAISGAGPAIEIVDLGDPSDIEQVLAENLFHRAYLFDEFTDVTGSSLAATRLDVAQDGRGPQTGIDPATALGDLVEVVRAVADQAVLSGDALRAGDVVMTGSVLPPFAISGGERFEVALQGGGSVALQIAPAAGTG